MFSHCTSSAHNVMASSSSSSKRPRLASFGRDSHVTGRGLQCVLHQVAEHGMPASLSRHSHRRDVKRIAYTDTSFGQLLQSICVDGVTVWYCHPFAMLELACRDSAPFCNTLKSMLDATGGVITLALYNDEIDPGKELQGKHARKIESFYWTIVEFDYPLMSSETAWFTLSAVRTDQRKRISGGVSRIFRDILKATFFSQRYDFRRGVAIPINGIARGVYSKGVVFICDERALKSITMMKGASGIHECCLCMNVIKHSNPRASVIPDDDPYFVTSTCVDDTRFRLHTDSSIRKLLARLKEIRRLARVRA